MKQECRKLDPVSFLALSKLTVNPAGVEAPTKLPAPRPVMSPLVQVRAGWLTDPIDETGFDPRPTNLPAMECRGPVAVSRPKA